MKHDRKLLRRIRRRYGVFYRLFLSYQKRVHMVETELGGNLHVC